MEKIDRNSVVDARKHIGDLLSIHDNGNNLAIFLSRQIEEAHKLNPNNWNLNLDLSGTFIRFNVGQEYCIEICKHEVLVLCLKDSLPEDLRKPHQDYFFRGHDKKTGTVHTKNLSEAPQCLGKVPGSIGLVFKSNLDKWIPLVSDCNIKFMDYAIRNTHILPQMIGAHSVGAMGYLSEITGIKLHNPSFAAQSISENENRVLKSLRKITNEKLNKLALSYASMPLKTESTINTYIRNPYVAEQAKRLANGICQDCHKCAPFLKKETNEPFLEVHHIYPANAKFSVFHSPTIAKFSVSKERS